MFSSHHFSSRCFFGLVALFILNFYNFAYARSYIPSGCGTYTLCNKITNESGVKNGEEICTNASDIKITIRKANWKEDKLEGNFFCALDDGTPFIEAEFKDGELHGEYKTWNRDLKNWNPPLKYRNGKREGISEIIGSNGHSNIVLYKNDKQHGYELNLKDGRIEDIRNCYKEGNRVELTKCESIKISGWDEKIQAWFKIKAEKEFAENNKEVDEKWPNGKTKLKYKLVNGKHEGAYFMFYENGRPQIERQYKDGFMIEEKIYFRENPQLESHSFYKKSWEYKLIQYYQNGNLKYEKEESESPKDKWLTSISYKKYFDNGKLAEQGKRIKSPTSWGDGSYDGEIQFFARSGELIEIQNWSVGKPSGTWRLFPLKGLYEYEKTYENGNMIANKVLTKDSKKIMMSREFYPDGSLKKEFRDPAYEEEN